ncbi:MAG: hypothetical protein AAF985_23930 [Bacteroidota bacterium]
MDDWTLKGDIQPTAQPTYSWQTWWKGTFQKQSERHLNEAFGFRNHLVRLNNQLAYELDRKAKANGVVVGKKGYLYEREYIMAHLGQNWVGEEYIHEKAFKLKKIKDTLQQLNVNLLVVLAPGKGSFFPEYIPDAYYEKDTSSQTNLKLYRALFQDFAIPYLDFNEWFIQLKDTSRYPLYGQGGIHWSRYAEFLVIDSLVNYLEELQGIKMPRFHLDSIRVSAKNRHRDNDIGEGMNLLFDLPTYPMAYPYYHLEKDSLSRQPNVLVVGDSYYFGLHQMGLSRKIFNNSKYWYYHRNIYPAYGPEPKLVKKVNVREELEKQESIILMTTDATLPVFAFGFIEQVYASYFVIPPKERTYQDWVRHYEHQILKSAKWVRQIEAKAKKWKKTVPEMVRIDAQYMARDKQ